MIKFVYAVNHLFHSLLSEKGFSYHIQTGLFIVLWDQDWRFMLGELYLDDLYHVENICRGPWPGTTYDLEMWPYLHTATIFDFIVFSFITLQLKLEPIKFARKLPPARAWVVKV